MADKITAEARKALAAVRPRAEQLLRANPKMRATVLDVATTKAKLSAEQQECLQPLFSELDEKRVVSALAELGIGEYERSVKHLITRDEKGYRHATVRRVAFLVCLQWVAFSDKPLSTAELAKLHEQISASSTHKSAAAPAKTKTVEEPVKLPKAERKPPPPVLAVNDDDDDDDWEDESDGIDDGDQLDKAVTQAYVATKKLAHAQQELGELIASLSGTGTKCRPSEALATLRRVVDYLSMGPRGVRPHHRPGGGRRRCRNVIFSIKVCCA